MLNKMCVLLCFAFLCSCNQDFIFDKYESVGNSWDKNNPVEFKFNAPDTVNTYQLFINIRNNQDYKFSNLFLIAELNYPNGKTLIDTLEYQMAKPTGEFLGTGAFNIKDNKLWYKGYNQPFVFDESGAYQLKVSHAMRQNGVVEGVKILEGVTEVGFRVEQNITD